MAGARKRKKSYSGLAAYAQQVRQLGQGLGALSQAQLAAMCPRLGPAERLAQHIWGQLGHRMDWAGLRMLIDINDLRDPETLIANLLELQKIETQAHQAQAHQA